MSNEDKNDEAGNSNDSSEVKTFKMDVDFEGLINVLAKNLYTKPPNFEDPNDLQEFWHEILLHNEQPFKCYATFLALPSDSNAIRYFTDYENEISLLSGHDCLIITLSNVKFDLLIPNMKWSIAIQEHISEGHAINVARLFDIDFTEFPCLAFFRDIHSSDHIVVPLKDMKTDDISREMRVVFSVVHEAISKNKDPLKAIQNHYFQGQLRTKSEKFTGKVQSIAGKTFEMIMEAWIKSLIK